MKRYFQAVTKDPSLKRSRPSTEDEENQEQDGPALENPESFMSWNTNSFLLRLKYSRVELAEFVTEHKPDVIAIQEVRAPAVGPKGGPKNRAELSDSTPAAREEKSLVQRSLAAPPFSAYHVFWSLADGKYSGVALLVRKTLKILSVAFCWDQLDQPCTGDPASPGFSSAAKKVRHEEEGRIICVEFPGMRVLNTYGVNNGWKEEAFQRRREWDAQALESISRIVQDKPLVWCGDMNVSHEDADVSHPEFFRNAKQPGAFPAPNDAGQPGFTPNERLRFSEILRRCDLVDTYRHLHPTKDYEGGFTWSGNPVGKYRGKRMRIDYFLVARSLLDRVVSSDIHGRGIEMEGFMKSDHCPLTMKLQAAHKAAAMARSRTETDAFEIGAVKPNPVINGPGVDADVSNGERVMREPPSSP